MRKQFVFILVILFSVSNCLAGFMAKNLADRYNYWQILKFSKFKFQTNIKIQGLFYETSITMRVRLGKGYNWRVNCEEPPEGSWEFIWNFVLPNESVITDCKMLDDESNEYVTAQMIDLSTAESIYDTTLSVPHLLLREYRNRNSWGGLDHFYQLKISPVGTSEEKEITITYLTPCRMFWDVRRIGVHSYQFYSSRYARCNNDVPAEFKVIDYDHPDKAPRVINDMPYLWTKNGNYWYAKTSPYSDISSSNSILRVEKETANGNFLQTFADNSHRFYQLSVLPHIQYSDRPGRHIIVAFDVTKDRYDNSAANRENLIDLFKYPLSLATTDKDSLAFVTSSFSVKWLDKQFLQRDIATIEQRLQSVKETVPKLNTLPFMLKQAVQFLNDRDLPGEIWFISNSQDHGYPTETVMDIVRQTYFVVRRPIIFRIIDVNYAWSSSYWIKNKRYWGNEYLYENLSRLSKGSMVLLLKYNHYDRVNAIIDCLAPTVSSVEINPMPQGGLAYSRIPLNFGRQNFNVTSRYYEIGLFDGTAPFQINYFGNFLDGLYSKSFSLEESENPVPEEFKERVKTFWYAQYIINQLLAQPQSYETIKYIEQLSIENRVLTPYSGFVIPGTDGYVGFKKLAAKDSVLIQEENMTESEISVPQEFELSAYPNPFNPKTIISIKVPDNVAGRPMDIKIINTMGQTIRSFESKQTDGYKIDITWNGNDDAGLQAASGIYFVVIKSGGIIKSMKITLLR
ncbi:MAG: T9SS type A sorting domain-containing protein [Calditrichaeota bacterium]|nr:T9SS type A sorting domain-containing protein [Calditrichota bacterium]